MSMYIDLPVGNSGFLPPRRHPGSEARCRNQQAAHVAKEKTSGRIPGRNLPQVSFASDLPSILRPLQREERWDSLFRDAD